MPSIRIFTPYSIEAALALWTRDSLFISYDDNKTYMYVTFKKKVTE